ncbi:hypothetical protein DM860_017581 [Cuscuta australis]|uniref:DUF4219 domain-containing protein n=1 Tax=Cuscuta australis TaxID=267555 RepID=A0A328DDU0_9ASTE|nr:hypothetical protein DM860_017581 [Cuscuta australis]
MEEGANVQRPPLLRGPHYNFWKGCMRAFLKSQGGRVWRIIETGWTKPTETNAEGVKVIKTFEKYSNEEAQAAECTDSSQTVLRPRKPWRFLKLHMKGMSELRLQKSRFS